ncbi:Peroxiredoxin [Filimonas lacunae]|uniref:Peroxiredoxin n=1 Tax=Filimonas lacunae TaxID=477680 RepID=A0A173MJ93_9BACT|nr:TlpA disulfide reductase family protein [Filimonas lacunae]BAV07536.1 thiol:disulfide interchange protein [Filimonas lacunae]SIT30037.1 Peroxiredoxin [Filimonas lacunae]
MNTFLKICFTAAAACPLLAHAQDPQRYQMNGYVKNLSPNNKAVLMRMIPGRMVFDTVDVVNGKFTFNGQSQAPQKAYLYVTHEGKMPQNIALGDHVAVYLENGTIEVNTNDSLKNAKVGGTPLNIDQQELVEMLKPFDKQVAALEARFATASKTEDSLESSLVKSQYEAVSANRDKALLAFVGKHKSSLVSLLIIRSYFDPSTKAELAIAAYDMLDETVKSSSQGQVIARMLKRAKALDVGSVAPEFTAKNTNGEDIALKQFRGKYVLIDFWASWCVPCRHENPNVVKAYNRFKDQNFTVLGFSLDEGDDGKNRWMGAIEKDGLTWMQLSDLAGWSSPIAMLYNLKAIPANFLLDPNGKIIARDLRGEALEQKLAEILKKS